MPTVTTNTVEPDRVLTASLAQSPDYQIGTPSSTSVTITSSVVPTLTLTANTTTISQGGAASFTITANQAPAKNTSVSFAVEGTAQPGQNYVPMAGTALLAAGQTQVTVTLQSLRTDVTFEPTDMIVGQWPIRIGTGLREGRRGDRHRRGHPAADPAGPERHTAGVGGRPHQAEGRPALHRTDLRSEHRGHRRHHRARLDADRRGR